MILFPNRTVVYRDEVVDHIKEEFHKRTEIAQIQDVVDQNFWDMVDQASWDSFPASDPPPWTLGSTKSAAAIDVEENRQKPDSCEELAFCQVTSCMTLAP